MDTIYSSPAGQGPSCLGYFQPLRIDFAFASPVALERNFLSNISPTWADFAASVGVPTINFS